MVVTMEGSTLTANATTRWGGGFFVQGDGCSYVDAHLIRNSVLWGNAASTAALAAFSHDSGLVPTISITLYMCSFMTNSFTGKEPATRHWHYIHAAQDS